MKTMRRLYELLTSMPAFLTALVWLMVIVALGTLAQARMPQAQALQVYFQSPLIWIARVIPLPGLPLTLGFIGMGVVAQLARQPLTLKKAGSWLSHLGVLALVGSGLAATLGTTYGYVLATEGVPTRLWQAEGATPETAVEEWPTLGFLPFEVKLEKFEHRMHPGTDVPAAFASHVTITPDGGVPWQATISMNEPLRFEGYTLYQASYLLREGEPPVSILSAVHDRTRTLPYVATALLALGLLLQMWSRYRSLVVVLFLLPIATAHAVEPTTMERLATLPVQQQGRVKPLLAVADTLVPFVRGERVDDSMAVLVRWMFAPAAVAEERLVIANPNTRDRLGLSPREGNRQPLPDVLMALQPMREEIARLQDMPEAKLAAPQKDLLQVAERAEALLEASRSLLMVRPLGELSPAVAAAMHVSSTTTDAALLLAHREELMRLVENPATQREAMTLVARLRMTAPERPNAMLRVIPPAPGSVEWLSLWQAAQPGRQLSGEQMRALAAWRAAAREYVVGGALSGPVVAELDMVSEARARPVALWLEEMWLRYPPITLSVIPLSLALGLTLWRWRKAHAVAAAATGWGLLGLGLLVRMVILARPPVATLYESVLFVAWVVMGAALLGHKRAGVLTVGTAAALVLVVVSHGLTHGQDTMGMLTAVLDTRLWLTVHVLTITAGYAASLLVAGVAAWALWQRASNAPPAARKATLDLLRSLTTLALLLTATGTLLGGVWASQSWGRFWGWDPKENGALELVLWLVLVSHIRLMRAFSYRVYLAAAGGTMLVVALSWFGVNLLNVGLHSYGFAQGLYLGLVVFCAVVCGGLGTLLMMDRNKATQP